jgi:WD40 repeat protein
MSLRRLTRAILPGLAPLLIVPVARADSPPDRVSFLKDVAPILVRNCVGCHNAKKSESKYDLTAFARLTAGGQLGGGIAVEPGKPEESHFVELIHQDGEPRMPYKQEPLASDAVALIERWVKEGAAYDGDDPKEDWVALLHRRAPVVIPEKYRIPVPISALAFSPDGTAVATSGNHEVNLWRVEDGSLVQRLRGVDERVYDIAFSPDGKWLATASGDPGRTGTVKLWAAEPGGEGKSVRDLIESNDGIFAVAFSPDSKRVAAAGADRAVRVWEIETGKLLTTIEDHADWILNLDFSPDGQKIATASRDKSSKVFDLATRETLATFSGHAETVHAVAFSPDGRRIATGGGDNLVRIWDPADDAKQVAMLGGFQGAVFRVQFVADGKQLIATSADATVRVFEGNAPRAVLQGHGDWIYSLAVASKGGTVASGSWDGEVRLWSSADWKPRATFLAAPGLTRPGKP